LPRPLYHPPSPSQRLLRRAGRAGRAMLPSVPVLELNPRHKLIEALSAKLDDETLIDDTANTLLDLARVQEAIFRATPTGLLKAAPLSGHA
jgi:molecular chaperone HtpG